MYIDGFNLHYGALKGTPYQWLDLEAFSRIFVQNHVRTTHSPRCDRTST
jgi:hypothetical protein